MLRDQGLKRNTRTNIGQREGIASTLEASKKKPSREWENATRGWTGCPVQSLHGSVLAVHGEGNYTRKTKNPGSRGMCLLCYRGRGSRHYSLNVRHRYWDRPLRQTDSWSKRPTKKNPRPRSVCVRPGASRSDAAIVIQREENNSQAKPTKNPRSRGLVVATRGRNRTFRCRLRKASF